MLDDDEGDDDGGGGRGRRRNQNALLREYVKQYHSNFIHLQSTLLGNSAPNT